MIGPLRSAQNSRPWSTAICRPSPLFAVAAGTGCVRLVGVPLLLTTLTTPVPSSRQYQRLESLVNSVTQPASGIRCVVEPEVATMTGLGSSSQATPPAVASTLKTGPSAMDAAVPPGTGNCQRPARAGPTAELLVAQYRLPPASVRSFSYDSPARVARRVAGP